jgi:hypothetical protein
MEPGSQDNAVMLGCLIDELWEQMNVHYEWPEDKVTDE